MHQHSHDSDHSHTVDSSSFVRNHLILLMIVIIMGSGLYLYSQNITSVTDNTLLTILVSVTAILVIVLAGRRFFGNAIRQFHGGGDSHTKDMAHSHDIDLETDGATINWARLYDPFVRFVMMGAYRKMIESTIELAMIQAGEHVLDVGCGTGSLAIEAKKASPPSAVIHGTDAAPEMIARAQQKAEEASVSVKFMLGLVERIEVQDASYDLVMNSLMMHHLPDDLKAKAYTEIFRVLKPGGRLLIVDFEPPRDRLTRTWLSLTPVKRMLQIDNGVMPPLLEDAGFEGITIQGTRTQMMTAIIAYKP